MVRLRAIYWADSEFIRTWMILETYVAKVSTTTLTTILRHQHHTKAKSARQTQGATVNTPYNTLFAIQISNWPALKFYCSDCNEN